MVSAHFSSLNMLLVCIGLLLVAAPYVLCTASFSMELYDQTSTPSSHLPTSTPSSRLEASIKHSASRANYLHSVNSRSPNSSLSPDPPTVDPYAILTSYGTVFVIAFHIGTQTKFVELVLNPGGSLVWICCHSCPNCYPSNFQNFHPGISYSYEAFFCNSQECKDAGYGYNCGDDSKKKKCEYNQAYTDNSWVTGIFSKETIRMPGTNDIDIYLPNILFGCTHRTGGHFPKQSLGYMGLGGGRNSFVRQLGSRGYETKFSYCLPAKIKEKSKVFFGSSGSVTGDDTQSTPMDVTNLYIVSVESINVNEEVVSVRGKFVMDAGTFLTYVDKYVLDTLIEMVKRHAHLTMIPVTPESTYKLCYSVTNYEDDVKKLPWITLNLAGQDILAMFVLKQENAFLRFRREKAMCLAIVEKKPGGLSIIGSHAQVNHRIGFDLEKSRLSFRPEICAGESSP